MIIAVFTGNRDGFPLYRSSCREGEKMTKREMETHIGLAIEDLMDDHVQNNIHRLGVLGAESVRDAIRRLGKVLVDDMRDMKEQE